MANIAIPYQLIPAVALEKRRQNMVSAIARGLTRLDRRPVDPTKTLHIACFGPSLRDTWHELRGKSPIIAMSGATKFLAERGITADYALEMDPRVSQLVVSLPAVPGVTYLVASCVCEEYFDRLAESGNRVLLWHTVSSNWEDESAFVAQHDPGQLVVHGGSTVGITAIHIGGLLGFSRFEIHGMDGSFDKDGNRHAAHHGGKAQFPTQGWNVNHVPYRTSRIMANAVAEAVNTAKNFPIITVWHGDGLTQARIRKANLPNACCADEAAKRAKLTGLQPKIVQTPPLHNGGFWPGLLRFLQPDDLPELVRNIAACEPRRVAAKYDTGTIPFESSVYLRALSRFYQPAVVAEVGTFIGTSALALRPTRVLYTCDRSNDCVPMTESIITHPYQSSTQMLKEIQESVDLFFFDGRIQDADIPEIVRASHPGTVYVFDDYTSTEKGVVNVGLIRQLLPRHALFTPPKGRSTLAVLAPFIRQEQMTA